MLKQSIQLNFSRQMKLWSWWGWINVRVNRIEHLLDILLSPTYRKENAWSGVDLQEATESRSVVFEFSSSSTRISSAVCLPFVADFFGFGRFPSVLLALFFKRHPFAPILPFSAIFNYLLPVFIDVTVTLYVCVCDLWFANL